MPFERVGDSEAAGRVWIGAGHGRWKNSRHPGEFPAPCFRMGDVAILATQSYGVTNLATLGGLVTFACDVNDAGQVVGYSTTAFNTHAFLWQNGQMTDLGTVNLATYTGNSVLRTP